MVGLGTLVNTGAVLAGGAIGVVAKRGLKPHFQQTMMQALGLATIFIGVSGTLKEMLTITEGALAVNGTMLLILSMILGSITGELLQIERRLERMGDWLRAKIPASAAAGGKFVEGFVTCSLVICVGAMAVMGSLQDGITGDPSTLFAKAALDFMVVLVFASTLGVGVLFSAVPLFLYQGAITLLASLLAPLLGDPAVLADLNMVGNVLIAGAGVNIAFQKDLHVGNMLPALLVPVFWHLFT